MLSSNWRKLLHFFSSFVQSFRQWRIDDRPAPALEYIVLHWRGQECVSVKYLRCWISVVKLGRVQDCAVFAELYRKLQGQVGTGMSVFGRRDGVKYTLPNTNTFISRWSNENTTIFRL